MKKLYFLLFVSFCAYNLYATEPISKFVCSELLPDKEFIIEATDIDENGRFSVDVPFMSSSNTKIDEVYLRISNKKMQFFTDALNGAKATYIKWSDAAKANNVNDLDMKKIDLTKTTYYEGVFRFGDWHYAFRVYPVFAFRIEKGNCILVIALTKMQAYDNQFISCDGGLIMLNSVEEIDNLIKALNPQLVYDYYAKKNKVESIFQ